MHILITGASAGIGQALAMLCLEQQPGIHLTLVARRLAPMEAIKRLCPDSVSIISADVSSETDRLRIVEHLAKAKPLTHIVNNAGTEAPVLPIKKLSLREYRQTQATNTEAPLFLTRDLLAKTPVDPSCRVLFTSSGAAFMPWYGLTAYAVSKAALEMVCASFRSEYADTGFEFATLLPGGVDTEIAERISLESKENFPMVEMIQKRLTKNGQPMLTPRQSAQFILDVLLNAESVVYKVTTWRIKDFDEYRYCPQS